MNSGSLGQHAKVADIRGEDVVAVDGKAYDRGINGVGAAGLTRQDTWADLIRGNIVTAR